MIELPGSYDFATLAGGKVQMFGFHLAGDSPAIGKTLAELRELGDLNAFFDFVHHPKRRCDRAPWG